MSNKSLAVPGEIWQIVSEGFVLNEITRDNRFFSAHGSFVTVLGPYDLSRTRVLYEGRECTLFDYNFIEWLGYMRKV
jgi:hypothetical protein